MLYASELIGKPVVDCDGQRAGRLQDMLATMAGSPPHPRIAVLSVHTPGKDGLLVSVADIAVMVGPAIVLARSLKDTTPAQASEGLWLARDVLDKEIIDTDEARVVRVNDLQIARVNGGYYLANINIGGVALVRRLGLMPILERLARLMGRTLTTGAIPWDNVELLPGTRHRRLRFTGGKANALPAADLADIIGDLTPAQSTEVVQSLDVEQLADTLEEVEPDFQASLVQSLSDEKVADVLEEMAPDEAADLLASLPEDRSQSLLKLMDTDEAADVRQLLTYPEDSAGGIMTTEVVTMRPAVTAAQAIALLRETAQEAETIYYVYVTDEENHLLGVFSLQSLILAQPDTPISQIMHDRIVDVKPADSQNDVAELITKYNLLAVPVVDDENKLLGLVTADDALDKILPAAWKKHIPRLYR